MQEYLVSDIEACTAIVESASRRSAVQVEIAYDWSFS